MFQNDELKSHLETNFSISSRSALIAEWNMNVPGNIFKLGNYRYRKNTAGSPFTSLPNIFDRVDVGGFYTGATDADTVVDYGSDEDENGIVTPLLFSYKKKKEKYYYSLEDCIKPFRPRSGINKLSFFNGKYMSNADEDMFLRPRYYMPHKYDEFKYWRSYRTEGNNNIEYGISKNNANGVYNIDDTVPFVVYKEEVPANRIVLKVQTNIGSVDFGTIKTLSGLPISDPLYGDNNKTVPQIFKMQYLDAYDRWNDAYTFSQTSTRDDGSSIFSHDGYLSVEYGLNIPTEYKDNFIFVGTISDLSELPADNYIGYAYIYKQDATDIGQLNIWNGTSYDTSVPQYGWSIGTDAVYETTQFVTDLTNPDYYLRQNDNTRYYREFVWIKGIRIVVESMTKADVPLELIEISPRLVVDLSNKLINFQVTKILSNLTSSSLPISELNVSTGSVSIFDDDQAFNSNNVWSTEEQTGSIVAKYLTKNIKFNFYEVILDVNSNNYYIPIKTLYSEGLPQVDQQSGSISINLRDFFFYLESITAPQMLLTEVSLSQAVCLLLDSIGFSNYVFKRLKNESDPVIPFFFVAPEQNVAEVLSQLAVATQSAMFFDEYNNFVVMTKGYLLDNTGERTVDLTLYGSQTVTDSGVIENATATPLPNIISIASADQKVYNAGTINYTTRYIQRSYGTLRQSQLVDQDKTWIYKPVLLWEVSGTEATKSLNGEKQDKYTLAAMPLNVDISSQAPQVVNRVIVNNTMDFGENVYFLARFQGYLYAGGEIIKYDAVQHNVTGVGNVWISNNLEYQKYFSELSFNGKIYPTGLVRIYTKPYYEEINGTTMLKNGELVEHGRGQFNTPIVAHTAGLDPYWSNNSYVQGCNMDSKYIFSTTDLTVPSVVIGNAGINTAKAEKSARNGIIKNFFASGFSTETNVSFLKTAQTGTVQSSALVFNGPDFSSTEVPRDFISYVWKKLDGAYPHIGTRMRIIGKIEANADRSQTPTGGMTYYNITGTDPTANVSIGGGSGGLAFVNPLNNNGYYFEIAALTTTDIQQYAQGDTDTLSVYNILFYKVQKDAASSQAIPVPLWRGSGNVLVDDGSFVGQYRYVGEENPTVYDLAIEYVDISPTLRTFYLYINQKLVRIVNDTSPLPIVNNSIGLFVRGTSRVMFENIYALSKNYADNSVFDINTPIASVFGDNNSTIDASEALTKYAISGMVQKTYLTGINPNTDKKYNLYYDEFGTIMRECSYFNIKYDRAYPALYATVAPTFNRIRGYTVSGFFADSYGAEFLIFNNTDTLLNLDETTGNYLRILGITFTQDTTKTLTADDYYKKRGNLSDPELKGQELIRSPYDYILEYDEVRASRIKYGKNEFTVDTPYIQDQDTAEDILGWLLNKNLRPRKAVGLSIFPIPTLQLGDLVKINYKNNDNQNVVASSDTVFVVYNIEYSKGVDGPDMTVYLSEV